MVLDVIVNAAHALDRRVGAPDETINEGRSQPGGSQAHAPDDTGVSLEKRVRAVVVAVVVGAEASGSTMMALAASLLPVSMAHSSGKKGCAPTWTLNLDRARLPTVLTTRTRTVARAVALLEKALG